MYQTFDVLCFQNPLVLVRNLRANDVIFENGNFTPLDTNTSFAVDEGEILVLFGLNGAGKSSLLRAILGENGAVSGSVSSFNE